MSRGAAKKVTIYVNEDTRYHRESLWSAIMRFLCHRSVGSSSDRGLRGAPGDSLYGPGEPVMLEIEKMVGMAAISDVEMIRVRDGSVE